MASPITNNPYTADQHLRFFAEFCQGVEHAGGTTPHMLTAVEATRGLDLRQTLWRGGCYAFVYNIPTAEVLWRTWEPREWASSEMVDWIRTNWKGLRFRKERKAARSPERLEKCMWDYATYMEALPSREWYQAHDMNPKERYQLAFNDLCDSVKYMGRYIAIRWLEFMHRAIPIDGLEMYDIHPKDGDHPRKALALIYPEYEKELMGGNDTDTIEVVNDVVEWLLEDLLEMYSVDTDYYTIQSLLCEYKQSVLAGRQYPGKSVDTELAYQDKVYTCWEQLRDTSEFWKWRKNIFPSFVLGEEQGWSGVRDELGDVLRDYGYTWSDYLYDYKATTDLANPVRRIHA